MATDHDPSGPITRRRLLKSAGRAAAFAAASALLPGHVRRALAEEPPRRGSLRDVRHLVFLMQENRSFDHYFGTLAGVRGFDDPNALKLSGGRTVFFQPDPEHPDGYALPFRLDTRTTSAQRIPSTDHSWRVQHEAWNEGAMDRWLPAHRKADGANGPYVMGYHTREDIPFQFALAEAFTLCDAYHCSVLGPTWPNRLYWMTGTLDPSGQDGGPILENKAPEGGLTWTTYAERLERAGVSWKVYQQEDNYGCNMLELFREFQRAPADSSLRRRGMTRGPEGQFESDAANDRLPAVSWIIPTGFQSEHPDFMPADGAAFVASKIDALASNPEVWAKTAFVLNYDENDGIFDHVPPIVPEAGNAGESVESLPIGSGYRVPCIVVSPWTVGGWVCSEPFDHTSCLRLMEAVTGVLEPNITPWRRRTFGDLTSTFRFGDRHTRAPELPDTSGPLTLAKYQAHNLPKPMLPGAGQRPPVQESGDRHHVPPPSAKDIL